jgi:hypothetical protein
VKTVWFYTHLCQRLRQLLAMEEALIKQSFL